MASFWRRHRWRQTRNPQMAREKTAKSTVKIIISIRKASIRAARGARALTHDRACNVRRRRGGGGGGRASRARSGSTRKVISPGWICRNFGIPTPAAPPPPPVTCNTNKIDARAAVCSREREPISPDWPSYLPRLCLN